MIQRLVAYLRRFTQFVAIFVLVLLPIFALYTHYKESHALRDLPADTWQHVAVRGVDAVVSESPTRQRLVERTRARHDTQASGD